MEKKSLRREGKGQDSRILTCEGGGTQRRRPGHVRKRKCIPQILRKKVYEWRKVATLLTLGSKGGSFSGKNETGPEVLRKLLAEMVPREEREKSWKWLQ